MTIKHDIAIELQRLAPLGGGALEVRTPDGKLLAQLSAIDQIGCGCDRLSYQSAKLAGQSLDRLKQISGDLTKRLNYLLEPVGLLEADAESCTVQLRSTPPQQGDDGRSYYELLVRQGGEILLLRYHKAPGAPRAVISALLTREVLSRLAEDFVAATG